MSEKDRRMYVVGEEMTNTVNSDGVILLIL